MQAGYRAIICNRPDGESSDQPGFNRIEAEAAAAGLQMRYVPAVSGAIGPGDVRAFAAALEELPGPVLAYCRTGTRSAILWALSEAPSRPVADILQRAAGAGYDLSSVLRPA